MRYLPHTGDDIASMLEAIGVKDLDALFSSIPESCRYKGKLGFNQHPTTEWELTGHVERLSRTMAAAQDYITYLGAGSYEHHIPESVKYLLSRGEFSTAYTPYQPEISQGTLQAVYEYQTLIERLLGMEVSNASMYDGASALAEALLMAVRVTRRTRILVSKLIHPQYRQVVQTYLGPTDYEVIELPYLPNGRTDLSRIDSLDEAAAVVVQSPNSFGVIEDLQAVGEKARAKGALFVVSFCEPLAYGILKAPGRFGADIVCGEGQSLGIPQSFGGPGLGIFASKMQYVRNMPGRLVGRTKDMDGRSGFVLTLATREQHIRRAKATSNICTNSSLCALAAAMYMASLGGTGFRELSQLNHDKAEYLKDRLRKAGCTIPFSGPTFNEFVVKFPKSTTYRSLLEKKIFAGMPLDVWYPELSGHYLLCVTEKKSRLVLDGLVGLIAEEQG